MPSKTAKKDKKAAAANDRQHHFEGPGMEPDAAGKAALRFIELKNGAKDKIKAIKDELVDAEKAVIEEMEESNRSSMSIDGLTFVVARTEAKTKLKVKATKRN